MAMYEVINYGEDDFDVLHEGSTIENHGSINAEDVLDWINGHEDDTFAFGSSREMDAEAAREHMKRQFGVFRR